MVLVGRSGCHVYLHDLLKASCIICSEVLSQSILYDSWLLGMFSLGRLNILLWGGGGVVGLHYYGKSAFTNMGAGIPLVCWPDLPFCSVGWMMFSAQGCKRQTEPAVRRTCL